MKIYKSSERVRKQALAYYYEHREKALAYAKQYRRQRGVKPHKPAMTREERLAVIRWCRKCGRPVTTPSLLLACQNTCIRCVVKQKEPQVKKNARARKLRASKTALVRQVKLERGCERCGKATKVTDLHFHHRDPSTKEFKVADGPSQLVSTVQLLAETAKCDVLCNICHEAEHA